MSFFSISCLIIYSFFSVTGGVASATISSNLAPGNYLIHHKIIALHLVTSFNSAEFYPGCAQFRPRIAISSASQALTATTTLASLISVSSTIMPSTFSPVPQSPASSQDHLSMVHRVRPRPRALVLPLPRLRPSCIMQQLGETLPSSLLGLSPNPDDHDCHFLMC